MNVLSTTIKKWGNSHGLRINKRILKQLNLEVDDKVDIISDNKSIIIKPSKDKNKELLHKLLSKIPNDCKPKVIDWGKPVGKEIW